MKLAGWKKRIRLDIDYTNKIGGSVTQFPVTIFLKPTNGDTWKVFNEVGNNYRKIAITKADGVTELKVEMELWDVANKVGILHTSLANWVIGGDTSIYLYYDGSHYDNPNVGNIASTAGQAVWDSNFKMVQHLIDYDTSHTKDSTSNNNDGTKKAANEPIQADGKIAKAQSFDGSNDYIAVSDNSSLDITDTITIEAWVKPTSSSDFGQIVAKRDGSKTICNYAMYRYFNNRKLGFYFYNSGWNIYTTSSDELTLNAWNYATIVHKFGDANSTKAYVNGVQKTGSWSHGNGGLAAITNNASFPIGGLTDQTAIFTGLIDEVRISNTCRSAAWIKASYNSLNDTLIKYLKEETLFSRRGIFYVPINTSNFFHFFR